MRDFLSLSERHLHFERGVFGEHWHVLWPTQADVRLPSGKPVLVRHVCLPLACMTRYVRNCSNDFNLINVPPTAFLPAL
jgi:hypothetical protein